MQENCRISFSQSGREALEKIQNAPFDLVLLDVMMPEMDGYEICRRIHELPEGRGIPVIFLTAKVDKDSIVRGFEAGAVDYIIKPFHSAELLARIRTHMELKSYRDRLEEINIDLNKELLRGIQMEAELRESREALRKVNRQLYEKATTDSLTGLLNRRKIQDFIEYEHERANRSQQVYSLVLADIDFFKEINDTYGHDCGDTVLQEISRILLDQVRKQDQVSRWGGEEFLLLLPDTDCEGAFFLSEKIRNSIENHTFLCGKKELKITMTFGICTRSRDTEVEDLIKQADIALYTGKERGRNCSIRYSGRSLFSPDAL
jgi:diguanylate cyclase (GGDEF)-like protein